MIENFVQKKYVHTFEVKIHLNCIDNENLN